MTAADVTALRAKYTAACALEPWGEAAAVAVLLGHEPIASRPEFARHVTMSGVNWAKVLEEPAWWPEARFLIATAAGLWTGRLQLADISRIPFLDGGEYEVWLAMVMASRPGKVPE